MEFPLLAANIWDGAFYIVALLFLVYQTWRGWRMGIVRAGLRLLAIVASGLVGWYGGTLVAGIAASIFPGFEIVAGILVGFVLALTVYLSLTILSFLLFKKTRDNSSSVIRWTYGFGGAIMGFLVGLVFVWAAVSGVRALGGIAAGKEESGQGNVTSGALSRLRESVEGDGAGSLLRQADPIPDSMYETITQFSRVTSNPEAMARLIEYPEVSVLLTHPKFIALTEDPAIQRAAMNRNVVSIMFHPKLLDLATDPEIIETARKIDLAEALNFALQQEEATEESQPDATTLP
jgi:hypothetical protein